VLRAVVDPNVLISAAISPLGRPAMVLRAAFARRFVLIACPHLLHELADVLERPKFRRYIDLDQARELVDDIAGVAEVVSDPEISGALTRDPTDDYLLALARAAEADQIVSGDADLLALATLQPLILSPRQFLETLGEERP
jgi:putative PIN family toxin of toxin-antitoxin system